VSVDSDECTIEVPFSFYADRIKDRKNSTIIIEAFAAEASIEATIRCVVAGTAGEALGVRSKVPGNSLTPDSSPLTSRTQDELAKDVLEVFGSASTVENAPAEVTSG